jgi:peptidoglycan/xylan/chitin deacetylase (PgdA/CDA1 family)
VERAVNSTRQSAPASGRRILALLDSTAAEALPDRVVELESRGVRTKIVDYRRLMSYVDELRRILDEHQIDLILFSRSDQVYEKTSIGPLIRALRVGYSSFSGIDSEQASEQTKACLDDFLAGGTKLTVGERSCSPAAADRREGTFSLLFDMEQLGCARFGLPRVLNLLDQFGATATFFATNFVPEVYSNVLDILVRHGHEVGLHGLYHEYLAGHTLDQQIAVIGQMKSRFGPSVAVSGANFLGRTDQDTVDAMIANGLRYFVAFMEHRYGPFAYRKMPLRPFLNWSPRGTVWMVPISVETYNKPWTAIRNMIDSARVAGRAQGWPHINILLHPFRDGSLRHIGDLAKIIKYLQDRLGYRATSLGRVVPRPPDHEPSSFVYYVDDRRELAQSKKCFWQGWWSHTSRYQQRIHNVYQALAASGRRPALCFRLPTSGTVYAVYPHLPEGITPSALIENDCLLWAGAIPSDVPASTNGRGLSLHAVVPRSFGNDLLTAVWTSRPRSHQDYAGLFTEAAMRVAYRLSGGRHIF